ncbi:MAG: hypothetical protein LWW95_05390 [Candidatus Desulfofervidus auxilii]|nr:hypothetical protein [Candidatus Desulfofervidus auxilii]
MNLLLMVMCAGKVKKIICLIIICLILNWIKVLAQEDAPRFEKEIKLIELLKQKEKKLMEKEAILKEKEKKLSAIKDEITALLKKLMALKKELEKYFAQLEAVNDDRLNQLAKMYESTPPEQAGKMLEVLEPKLAAQIILRMDKTKAGAILGYLNPQIARKITEEMTKLR